MDTMEQQTNGRPPQKGGLPGQGVGPVLGIIIIVILLALGGLYYFTVGVSEIRDQNAVEQVSPEQEATAIATQGTTSNLNDIQTDAEATDLSGLDSAAANIDASLQTQ